MFLLPLAIIAACGLTLWFVFATRAPVFAKVSVVAVLVISIACRYARFAWVGFYLQVALSLFLLLYQKTRAR